MSQQQVIALAGVFQVAALVDQLARTGDVPQETCEPLIKSLFIQNPDDFNDIYGDPSTHLVTGLKQVLSIASQGGKDIRPNTTRYVVGLLHLEKKLQRNPNMLDQLGQGINQASRQVEHFSLMHENTIAALADLYKNTLGQLDFRIKVTGNPTYLQNPHTANRVRALLLAGIRAAILWRQVGGKRWHFITSRKRYANEAIALLERTRQQTH